MADMKVLASILHMISRLRYFAERTAVMYVGHMVEWGESDSVTQRPRHPYTQLLLSAVPEVGRKRDAKRASSKTKNQIPLWKPDSVGCPFVSRCTLAKERCSREMPTAKQVESDHFVCCFAKE